MERSGALVLTGRFWVEFKERSRFEILIPICFEKELRDIASDT